MAAHFMTIFYVIYFFSCRFRSPPRRQEKNCFACLRTTNCVYQRQPTEPIKFNEEYIKSKLNDAKYSLTIHIGINTSKC